MPEATWNRDELYEKVWSKPVTKVAEEFGVSDVAIAKVCRKLCVPVPGRGYWAKKQNGHAVSRKPLPKLKEPITVSRNVSPISPLDSQPTPLHLEDKAEFDRLDRLASGGAFAFAPNDKLLRHPLIVVTRDALRNGTLDKRKILRPAFRSHSMDVRVGKDSVRRVLELLACIVGCAEAHNGKVVVPQTDQGAASVFLAFGQNVPFSISESAHRLFVEKPPVPRRVYAYVETVRGKPVEFIPTGKLTLEMHTYGGGLRRVWKDGKQPLEALLPEIMTNFFKAAVLQRRESISRAEVAERRRLREIALNDLRRSIEEEERRVRTLEQEAENWRKAKTIREYVLRVIEAKKQSGDEVGPDTPTGTWVVWALQQADRLDPMVKNPPSILDRKKELEAADRFNLPSTLWRR